MKQCDWCKLISIIGVRGENEHMTEVGGYKKKEKSKRREYRGVEIGKEEPGESGRGGWGRD